MYISEAEKSKNLIDQFKNHVMICVNKVCYFQRFKDWLEKKKLTNKEDKRGWEFDLERERELQLQEQKLREREGILEWEWRLDDRKRVLMLCCSGRENGILVWTGETRL